MSVSPARAAAFEILLRIETTDAYASELLHASRFQKLRNSDHRLLTELVMGVLRSRDVLDSQIGNHSAKPLQKLDPEVRAALRLGAYQILFLDRIPKHAAVHESVELVKRAHKGSAAGMVNAILRKIQPGEAGGGDACSSHPEWLVRRWRRNYGQEAAAKICAYDRLPPRTALRIAEREAAAELKREEIRLLPGRLVREAFIVESGDITRTKAFHEQRVTIQDEASQLVALLAGGGRSVLDCCAAPGGKTRILAERSPRVIALELHPHRASLLRRLVLAGNLQVIAADARAMPVKSGFDRVLVDAPCTGTGTLARNPEILWRLKEDDIHRLKTYQAELLRAAMKQLAAGGRLTYSTCSLEPEEGPEVIEEALAADRSFRVVDGRKRLEELRTEGALRTGDLDSFLAGPYLRTSPGVHAMDGFFAAVIERR